MRIMASMTCLLLLLGLLVTTQTFATGSPRVEGVGGDHHSLAMYYEEQAQLNNSKARDWDFAADYYQKFPGNYNGKRSATEHIATLRSVAEDFRKAAAHDEELAREHRSLMRKDVIE